MENLYGVIGCPIAHSMSPAIHNDAFKNLKIDAHYGAFHVEPENLKAAIEGIKALGIKGFNVTIPHKIDIIPFLDEVHKTAEIIGAVNTVVNDNGKLIGYNTDGNGYVESLKSNLTKSLTANRFLIIGAGGAARAIYYTLASEGCTQIDLCNRTVEKAEKLVNDCPFEHESRFITIRQAEQELEEYDVIINTTASGLHPNVNEQPISLKMAKEGSIISDIIYNPIETALLKEAKERGLIVHNGVGMFVYQAALAFKLWTGEEPDIKRMKSIVYEKLGGNIC
ncbi:shikimate dehydrogenase [Metabacillus fastidiosus]|uniref:shikimate dehydrogenase n=1 Tax=Metabacillus fastidiosus TaxID=1458 RepID=UPI002E1B3DF5|nr:shikimate dehydrogenase [Metabacillus fastidiosus]